MKTHTHTLLIQASVLLGAIKWTLLAITVLLVTSNALRAQAGANALSIPLEVSNNHGNTTMLRLGIHEMATRGLDASLGERELPPVPPTEVYDVRLIGPAQDIQLGEGSLIDLRPWSDDPAIFSERYRILYQPGGSWPSVSVRLPSSLPRGITQLRINGKVLTAGDSAVGLPPSVTMDIMVDYDLTPPSVSVSPSSLVFAVRDEDTALPPAQDVRITPSIANGSWSASTNDDWISLDRTVGSGVSDLSVRITRLTFTQGRSSGSVEIRIVGNSEATILPVHVDMTTAVHSAGVPGSVSIRSISPHPVRTGHAAIVTFVTDSPGPASLSVIDALGRVFAKPMHDVFHNAGVHTTPLPTAEYHLSPGIYYLQLVVNGSTHVTPFIVW